MNGKNQFWLRVILVFFAIIGIVLLGRVIMLPDSWGEYGYYRGDFIDQEAHKDMKYGTNESCRKCHGEVYELKEHSSHNRLSCEVCHAPVVEHVKEGKKFANMPTKKGEYQISLCLKCHQKTIGRPEKFPMIDQKTHLSEQNVKSTHTCDQCHTVHAPLENMKHVKKMRSLKEALNEK